VGENKVICVVDDDPSMGRMLARGIRAGGYDVAIFTSAEQLLSSGQLDCSACLILDVDLPGMTGIELQQKLSESGAEIPVIVISGQADHSERALKAGAIGFFNKPFSIDSLVAAIQAIQPQISV
jgi:FixJ family two-component response regulator